MITKNTSLLSVLLIGLTWISGACIGAFKMKLLPASKAGLPIAEPVTFESNMSQEP